MIQNDPIGQCSPEGCNNGGTCIKVANKKVDEFVCACTEMFSGDRCERKALGLVSAMPPPYLFALCITGFTIISYIVYSTVKSFRKRNIQNDGHMGYGQMDENNYEEEGHIKKIIENTGQNNISHGNNMQQKSKQNKPVNSASILDTNGVNTPEDNKLLEENNMESIIQMKKSFPCYCEQQNKKEDTLNEYLVESRTLLNSIKSVNPSEQFMDINKTAIADQTTISPVKEPQGKYALRQGRSKNKFKKSNPLVPEINFVDTIYREIIDNVHGICDESTLSKLSTNKKGSRISIVNDHHLKQATPSELRINNNLESKISEPFYEEILGAVCMRNILMSSEINQSEVIKSDNISSTRKNNLKDEILKNNNSKHNFTPKSDSILDEITLENVEKVLAEPIKACEEIIEEIMDL